MDYHFVIQNMKTKTKRIKSPYLIVFLSFFIVILLGAFLLSLPISHINGQWGNVMTAFFTSTSAVCVTGLSVVNVGQTYSTFGQVMIALLIQIGGLGFVTIFVSLITVFGRKLGFYDRFTISKALNFDSLRGLGGFALKVVLISLSFELLGFILYLGAFIPYVNQIGEPIGNAFMYSFFHSISAFNNAGFDILGASSFEASILANSIYLNIITMLLIICGGIGFLVYIDIHKNKKLKFFSTYTKIVLFMTVSLIVIGFLMFLVLEWGSMTPLQALFQSVTTRTAGFSTYPQSDLSLSSQIVTMTLMFTGASPLSTAGGVKTTTIFIVLYTLYRFIRGKNVALFNRRLSSKMITRSMSLIILALIAIFVSFFVITAIEQNNIVLNNQVDGGIHVLFECFSAFGTVGLSMGVTSHFSMASQIIICLLMFFGRLGPMTLICVFNSSMEKDEETHYKLLEENILIG